MSDAKDDRRWIAGEPRVFMGDDGRPRLDRLPIDASPPPLPRPWPGGSPRFPIDFDFYLTALRAELAHLIHRARAYREAWGTVERPPTRAAAAVFYHAQGIRHYHAGLLREAEKSPARIILVSQDYMPPLDIVVDRIADAGGGTIVDTANAMSAPETLRILEWAYGFLPDFRFNLDIPSESVDAPASTGPEPPADAPDAPTAMPTPTGADGIDYGRIASDLRKDRKPMQAALVEYMATRDEALYEDVAGPVHGDVEASDGAIEANVRRTKDSLAAMHERLTFKVASGRVFRETSEK